MAYQLNGKIKQILQPQQGTSSAGKPWMSLTYVVSNNDGYEGKEVDYALEVFGEEKCDNFQKYNKVGDEVQVDFNVSSREYNGRYYTKLSSFRVTNMAQSAPGADTDSQTTAERFKKKEWEDDSDVPF